MDLSFPRPEDSEHLHTLSQIQGSNACLDHSISLSLRLVHSSNYRMHTSTKISLSPQQVLKIHSWAQQIAQTTVLCTTIHSIKSLHKMLRSGSSILEEMSYSCLSVPGQLASQRQVLAGDHDSLSLFSQLGLFVNYKKASHLITDGSSEDLLLQSAKAYWRTGFKSCSRYMTSQVPTMMVQTYLWQLGHMSVCM